MAFDGALSVLSYVHAAPTGLLCDLLVLPESTVIATTTPTLGWIVNGGRPGPAQAAYEVRVVRIDLEAAMVADAWSGGRVVSAQSINRIYDHTPLVAGASYEWTVRTWASVDGEPGAWAEPQRFTISNRPDAVDGDATSVYPLQTVDVTPLKVEQKDDGLWAVDFGRQAFGWLEVEMESAVEGMAVVVRLGEAWRDGALDRTPPGSVRYVEASLTLRAGRHVYRVETPVDARNTGPAAIKLPPKLGVVLPFRYAEVEVPGEGVTLLGATLVRVQYPFNECAASFVSSSGELNEIWELCRYTIQATSFAGYYVDGDRERIPYEADAYINQLCHYGVDREFSLARRTHEYLLAHPTWPTEWKQHSILIAWADYEATGDDRSLRRHYDVLKNEKLLMRYAQSDGLLGTGRLRDPALGRTDVGDLVDWPPGERDGFDFREVNTVVNAFHYRTLVLMRRIAAAVGRAEDAAHFEAEAARVYRSFNDRLFDAARGIYADGEGSDHSSQHANLFPLAFGLVPPERISDVAAYVKARGMACSVYPAQYLLEGLFEAREAEHAVGLMTGGGLRSWRNMLDQGATLTWEAWDQGFKPNQDWNHAWGAVPGNIIPRYVLGVRPLEPGYGRVLIDPQLGGLTEARGVVPTMRGPISVRAWREGGVTRCEARVPANVTVEYASSADSANKTAGMAP